MGIGIGIGNGIWIGRNRGGGVVAIDGAPSNLVLAVVSDTEIDGTFTEGSTNQDGFYVYISTDNITFTLKTTVLSGSFQAIGLTSNTLYYFYVTAYKGSAESAASNIDDATTITSEQAYLNLGFGAFICWSMSTFNGADFSTPDLDPDIFAPTDLDIDDWLDTFVDAGMKYAVISAKTNDGWCLWPTTFADPEHSPYGIGSTTWYTNNGQPDIIKLFIDGCRSRNLEPVLYFSTLDTTHETRSGTDETTGAAVYNAMIFSQITELLSNYGNIRAIWLDGLKWHQSYTYIPYAPIYNLIKSLQPNCLVLNNEHTFPPDYSQIQIHEVANLADDEIPEGNTFPAEEVQIIRLDSHWNYLVADSQTLSAFHTPSYIYTHIIQANSRNGNYLITVTPDLSCHLPIDQKKILKSIALYGTVEPLVYAVNTVQWNRANNENFIEKNDITGLVSAWYDEMCLGHNFLQATEGKRPVWLNNEITFDGIQQYLKTANYSTGQPFTLYLRLKMISWTLNDYIIDGLTSAKIVITQQATTPGLKAYAGTATSQNDNLVVGEYGVIVLQCNGANSIFQINESAEITGNFGGNIFAAVTLGCNGDTIAAFSNIAIKEFILKNSADDQSTRQKIKDYLYTV